VVNQHRTPTKQNTPKQQQKNLPQKNQTKTPPAHPNPTHHPQNQNNPQKKKKKKKKTKPRTMYSASEISSTVKNGDNRLRLIRTAVETGGQTGIS